MPRDIRQRLLEFSYHDWAQRYLRSLPLEHFMEATSQATQRKISLESLDLVHAQKPEVQVFNELLVQYPRKKKRRPGQVVPDNMVVVCETPIKAEGSFDVPLQPAGPFWVMECVSKNTKRKDNEESFDTYETDLKVPYYSMFTPDDQELVLYKHNGKKYVAVQPNEHGRYAIPELELEIGLLDGWMRFWFRGELLPLPADLLRSLEEARQRAEQEKRRAEQEKERAEQQTKRADQEMERANLEKQRADAATERAHQLEQELERLRAQLQQAQQRPPESP
jgi:Uma2 family endonuclease